MTTPTRLDIDGEYEKQCGKCGEWWPLDDEFFKRQRGTLVSPCRACGALWDTTPSSKPKRWQLSTILLMHEDYKRGLTLKEVGSKYGLHAGTVCRLFTKNGLARRQNGGLRISNIARLNVYLQDL